MSEGLRCGSRALLVSRRGGTDYVTRTVEVLMLQTRGKVVKSVWIEENASS